MVQAFVGLVGGGKTCNSVRRMMSYIAKGGTVCTNILLNGWDDKLQNFADNGSVKTFLRSLGWEYQPGQYVYIPFEDMVSDPYWYKKIPAGRDRDHRTLCVVDEATDLFDSLDGGKLKSDFAYRELFRFLRLSRHAHIDVLFICQDLQAINVRLKGLVSGIWRSTDMKGFKLKGIPIPFPFDTFLLQLFDRTGKNLIQREWVPKDPRIFTLYESESFGGSLGVKWADTSISDGTIKRKADRMTRAEIMTVYPTLVITLILGIIGVITSFNTSSQVTLINNHLTNELASARCVTNFVTTVESKPKKKTSLVGDLLTPSKTPSETRDALPPTNTYHRGSYRYHRALSRVWIDFDGSRIVLGKPSPFGMPVHIDPDYALCQKDDGTFAFLTPCTEEKHASQSPLSDSGRLTMVTPLVHTKETLP